MLIPAQPDEENENSYDEEKIFHVLLVKNISS